MTIKNNEYTNNLRKKVCHIHIPKCGGTFIGNLLYHQQTPHEPLDEKNKPSRYGLLKNENYELIFTIIRNPISFYKSLYTFFKNHDQNKYKISNKFLLLAKKYDNINDFIKIILLGPLDKKFKNSGYDNDYNPEILNYGLFTHYLKFFCGPFINNLNEKPEIFIKQIKESNICFFYLETLSKDLNKLYEKLNNKNISYILNKDIITNKSNKNLNNINYNIDKKVIELINEKDKYVFKFFNYI